MASNETIKQTGAELRKRGLALIVDGVEGKSTPGVYYETFKHPPAVGDLVMLMAESGESEALIVKHRVFLPQGEMTLFICKVDDD